MNDSSNTTIERLSPAAGSGVAWTREPPTADGVYLSAFDEYDDEPETFHFRAGKLYKPDGEQWVSWGGVWKRIGDLPNNQALRSVPAADVERKETHE